jgi:hypothetical protein
MEQYMNLGGDSDVTAYEIGEGWIRVQFRDGWIYTYTNQSAGQEAIEQMKSLAIAGQGLNGYISRSVREAYASKRK